MSKNQILKNYKVTGEMLPIFTYPEAILKKIASPVTVFDDKLQQLCLNMLFTMYHAPGIGLAAPQIGVSQRIFVMDIDYKTESALDPAGEETKIFHELNPQILINPEFIKKEGTFVFEEGCLSVPGVYEEVTRANKVLVKYQNLDGSFSELEAEGLLAVCLQHENDHLDGIVFLERLSGLKKKFATDKYLKKKNKI